MCFDMWSVGVMIFCLLSGEMPFRGKTRDDLCESIIASNFNFDSEAWVAVSDDVKHLISNLLVMDPDKHYTATEALQSEWFHDKNRLCLSYNRLNLSQSQLKTFNARLKFKSAVLTAQSMIRWKKRTRESQERK
jgi:serine/threonine protein kinase